jgi:hypothetical protein
MKETTSQIEMAISQAQKNIWVNGSNRNKKGRLSLHDCNKYINGMAVFHRFDLPTLRSD